MTEADPQPRTWPAWTALGLCVGLFVAGEPLILEMPAFGAGYMLRRFVLALALGLLLALAAWLPSRFSPPRTRTLVWLAAPLGIFVLGLLTQTGAGWRHAVRHGIGWLALGLLPLLLARAFETPRFARRTWLALVFAGCALAVCGVVELWNGGRVAASFGRPAVAGVVFGALLGPTCLLVRSVQLRALACVLLGIGTAVTGSRTAYVATVLGLGIAFALGAATPAWRRTLGRGVAVVGVVLAGWLALGLGDVVALPGNARTIEVRQGLHRAAATLIAERPLTGHGLGRFASEFPRVRELDEARLEPGRRAEHAHLDLLHVGSEGGVPSVLLLVLWFGGALVLARHVLRNVETPGRRAHAAAATGVLATVGIAGLGDGILIDPAPLLLAVLAVASLLVAERKPDEPGVFHLPVRVLGGILALGSLVAALGLSFDARADHALQDYVNTRVLARIAYVRGESKEAADARTARVDAALERMVEGLRLREDNPEAHFQRGVRLAERRSGFAPDAAKAFRRAAELDAGKTEARLNLAQLYVLGDRIDDARAVLLEAGRRDPTRYDVWMRLGHVILGPEPIPGDPPDPDTDWVEALKRYNQARAVAPDRFEYGVALARMDRRKAKSPDEMKGIDQRLEKIAEQFSPEGATPLEKLAAAPAELIVEAFRVAEKMGTGEGFPSAVLRLALQRDPDVAIGMRREIDRILAEAQRREDAAKERAKTTKNPREFDAAERAFSAAAIRLAAMLQEGRLDLPEQLTQARGEKQLKRLRMSLARYRGLLAATSGANVADVRPGDPVAGLRWRCELLREAAVVASRVDGGLARTYWSRGFTLDGMLQLEVGKLDRALEAIRRALEYDDTLSDAHYQLARVHVARAEMPDAEKALLKALELGPHWKRPAMLEPDFAALRRRPAIDAALRTP